MRTTKIVVNTLLAVPIIFLASAALFGQGLDGTLRGQVRDPSGALVPGVMVTARNDGTGAVRSVESTSIGAYTLTNLLVGTYTVSAELKGFRKYVRPNVEVRANQVVEADIVLEVGEVTDVVAVE